MYKRGIIFAILLLINVSKILNENVTGKEFSGNLPPGLAQLSRGVDIVTLDLMPVDPRVINNGFQQRVLDFTCTLGKKWTFPFDQTLSFDIPDQIDIFNALPGGILDTKDNVL